jgi:hypothetical protein
LQHAQQLALKIAADFANFIEKDRPASRTFK